MPDMATCGDNSFRSHREKENGDKVMKFNVKKFVQIERIKHEFKSDAEVARRCGWFPAALSRRLNTPDMLKLSDLEKIADAMNCDLDIKFIDRK